MAANNARRVVTSTFSVAPSNLGAKLGAGLYDQTTAGRVYSQRSGRTESAVAKASAQSVVGSSVGPATSAGKVATSAGKMNGRAGSQYQQSARGSQYQQYARSSEYSNATKLEFGVIENQAVKEGANVKFVAMLSFITLVTFMLALLINIHTSSLSIEQGNVKRDIEKIREDTQSIRAQIDSQSDAVMKKATSLNMVQRTNWININIGNGTKSVIASASATEGEPNE
ncbi:hypothetical protein FACS1894125_5420 [Actinomycetota bacterium]|nr:hypothetical protein FACS1894125_5420 [Actinomycetota bacterium]